MPAVANSTSGSHLLLMRLKEETAVIPTQSLVYRTTPGPSAIRRLRKLV